MKKCGMNYCGKEFQKDEELNWSHIYCPSCNKVIHFNIQFPDRHVGTCVSCDFCIEEFNNGRTYWIKNGKIIYVL